MTITMSRRALFGMSACAGAALLWPQALLAAAGHDAALADWRLGLADVDGDIAPQLMRRVHGRSPAGFAGTLFRNGPAKFRRGTTSSGHWFDGDGLMRSYRIDASGSVRLAARFADTPKRRQESALGRMVVPGFGTAAGDGVVVESNDDTNPANTSVIALGGELLALWEAGSPLRMDAQTLASNGFRTFRPDLAHVPFLAHPRIEPDGRVWNLGLSGQSVLIWHLSASGALEAADVVPLPRASYMHDFTATARHLVIVLQPWIQDHMSLPFVDSLTWRPEQGTQVLVIDKADLSQRRLFELPTFSFFHLGDAWEERDGTIRFDGCIDQNPDFATIGAPALLHGNWAPVAMPALGMVALHADGRATLDRTALAAEFPRTDHRYAGMARRRTVHVGGYDAGRPLAQSVGVWDWSSGRDDSFHFGDRHIVEEFVFAPAPGDASEMAGHLIGTTINLNARATELHVFDARRVAAGPVATWRADVVMPVSFHGTFVA